LTHWSGHPARLNRVSHKKWGDEIYAFEELIAELGSSFLSSHFNIDITQNRHPQYLKSWINVMGKQPLILYSAASKAQEAYDYLIS
jgi:antirestriction protein ArdC